MDRDELRLFGDALAKPFGISLTFLRTLWLVAFRPLFVARTISSGEDSREPLKLLKIKTIAPGAFLLSEISVAVVIEGVEAKVVHTTSPSLELKLELNLLPILGGVIYAFLVQSFGGRLKPRVFTLAAFCYVVGSLLLIPVITGIAAETIYQTSDVDCYSAASLASHLHGHPSVGVCGVEDTVGVFTDIAEIFYLITYTVVVQHISRTIALLSVIIGQIGQSLCLALIHLIPIVF